MDDPRTTISIVTPSYQQARFLEETLRSVISQRDQVREYFVLDGGSTDGSVDLIHKYASHIDYWVCEKDKGQSDAIHRGFCRATGDVLGWLNSDDVLLPGSLAKVRRAFDDHPEWDVLTGYHVSIDADSRILGLHRNPREHAASARRGVIHVAQQTCFFRRRLYESVGGLDLSLHCVMDTELWVRMLAANATWGHIPDYLAAFRIHAGAKGQSWLKEYGEEGALMRGRYPTSFPTGFRGELARFGHRLKQTINGQYLRAFLATHRYKGCKLTDVFGNWLAPAEKLV
jgi:glycosyltransferase involved in cell wall biosynthesis